MIPNPGGQLAPENIVGREELIRKMWSILDGRCIYMNDLRRVGKTMILRKMAADPPQGWHTVKRDLGGQTRRADPERTREVLKRLQQDHYLSRDEHGRYAFRFSLIARWWRHERSL